MLWAPTELDGLHGLVWLQGRQESILSTGCTKTEELLVRWFARIVELVRLQANDRLLESSLFL